MGGLLSDSRLPDGLRSIYNSCSAATAVDDVQHQVRDSFGARANKGALRYGWRVRILRTIGSGGLCLSHCLMRSTVLSVLFCQYCGVHSRQHFRGHVVTTICSINEIKRDTKPHTYVRAPTHARALARTHARTYVHAHVHECTTTNDKKIRGDPYWN